MMTSVVSTTAVTIYHAALVFFFGEMTAVNGCVCELSFCIFARTQNTKIQNVYLDIIFFHKNHTLKVHWLLVQPSLLDL